MFNIFFFLPSSPIIRGGGIFFFFFPCISRLQHPLLPQKRLCTAVLLGGLLTPRDATRSTGSPRPPGRGPCAPHPSNSFTGRCLGLGGGGRDGAAGGSARGFGGVSVPGKHRQKHERGYFAACGTRQHRPGRDAGVGGGDATLPDPHPLSHRMSPPNWWPRQCHCP